MSRNRKSDIPTFKKEPGYSKGGYKLNRNGVPLDRLGVGALSSNNPCNYHYKGNLKVGRYTVTMRNLTDI